MAGLTQPGLVCAGCGRAYGVRASDRLAANLQARDTPGARLAALLTGWTQDSAGAWFCGLPGCVPAEPDTPAAPWWQGHADKHV